MGEWHDGEDRDLRRGKFKILGAILAILALIIIIPALMVLPLFWSNPRGDLKVFFHTPLPRSLKVLGTSDMRPLAQDWVPVYYKIALDARDFGALTRSVRMEKSQPASRQEWDGLLSRPFFEDLKKDLLWQPGPPPGAEPQWPHAYKIMEGSYPSTMVVDERSSPSLHLYLVAFISYQH